MSQPASGRYLPTGSDPRVALDTQTGRLCRTVEAADYRADLPQCGKEDAEQVVQVDVDPRSWADAEITVTCSAKEHLLAAYSMDGKGKQVTRNCTIKNLTNKTVPLAAFDKVRALFRLPDGRVIRGYAYLGSQHHEIPAHGTIDSAGLFAGKNDCPIAQSDFDCADAKVMQSRELLITDTVSGVRYHILIE